MITGVPAAEFTLERFRERASLLFAILLWFTIPVVVFVARAGTANPLQVGGLATTVAAAGTAAWWFGRGCLWARLTIAAALTAVPFSLSWAASGTVQLDWHALFFVVNAMLVAYIDWRPVALAGSLTFLQHVLPDLHIVPDVIMSDNQMAGMGSGSNGNDLVLHATIILVQCGVLFWIVQQMNVLFKSARSALDAALGALARLRLLESAVDHVNDGIFITDTSRLEEHNPRIIYANRGLAKTLRYDHSELVGAGIDILRGPATDMAVVDQLFDDLQRTGHGQTELVNPRKDGGTIEAEISADAIAEADGVVSHFVFIHRDIGQRKRAEAALLAAKLTEETNAALVREISERKLVEAQLVHTAFHDQLTGLPNRTLFVDRLEQALSRSRRPGGRPTAILYLDCDRFKLVNDSFGHAIGDLLLCALARRIESYLRPGDTLARLGGDEFTVLLDEVTDEREAVAFAELILTGFVTPFSLPDHELFVTASIGIATSVQGSRSPDDLLRDADIAMYRAKGRGKHRCEVFRADLLEQSERRLRLETDLRHAIARGELCIHYQPIVSLEDRRLTGFEALVRWQHPQLGRIGPVEFIPIAEETGLIVSIGAWVMREACRQTRLWQLQFPNSQALAISVNVSAAQLHETDFLASVDCTLAETGLPPSSLHVEITESMLISDLENVGAVLDQLRDRGIKLHIDDFGTGYSSLAYLHRFPIDTLKIDKSFVSDIESGLANPQIVETIIALARQLGIRVTAEGIETVEQELQLTALHCTNGQGFHFSKALDADAITGYLAIWDAEHEPFGDCENAKSLRLT